MIELDSLSTLKTAMRQRVADDAVLLDELCADVRPLRSATRRIQPRATTAISLVGTDGGNNKIHFDPFLIQIVRVVDSSRERVLPRGGEPNQRRNLHKPPAPCGGRHALDLVGANDGIPRRHNAE